MTPVLIRWRDKTVNSPLTGNELPPLSNFVAAVSKRVGHNESILSAHDVFGNTSCSGTQAVI